MLTALFFLGKNVRTGFLASSFVFYSLGLLQLLRHRPMLFLAPLEQPVFSPVPTMVLSLAVSLSRTNDPGAVRHLFGFVQSLCSAPPREGFVSLASYHFLDILRALLLARPRDLRIWWSIDPLRRPSYLCPGSRCTRSPSRCLR